MHFILRAAVQHIEEISRQILITPNSAFKNGLSLDVLLLYWIYLHRTILLDVRSNNRLEIPLNFTIILHVYPLQIKNCNS